ncbi:MAG: O-antigen ligase family protein [Candidatus Pelagibacter sp.]
MIFYNERHKYRFYYYLSLIGFITSFIAILFYLYGNPDILIFKNSYYKNSSTGFFINRTALAVFLIFCLIASFELLKNYEENKSIQKSDYFIQKLYIRLFVVFISIGIITSFSRIGNFLLLITILFYLLNEIFYTKGKNYSFRIIILLIVLFDVLILGIYFGSSEIINRFYFLKEEFTTISGEISSTKRFDIIKFGISELNNFIFFGYGAGGFENIFKLKFVNTSSQFANHAHADIIEFLGEFGLIGFFLLLSSFFKFYLDKQSYSFVNILLIFYLIIILPFDFTLHIPVVQILFVIFFILNKKLFS